MILAQVVTSGSGTLIDGIQTMIQQEQVEEVQRVVSRQGPRTLARRAIHIIAPRP